MGESRWKTGDDNRRLGTYGGLFPKQEQTHRAPGESGQPNSGTFGCARGSRRTYGSTSGGARQATRDVRDRAETGKAASSHSDRDDAGGRRGRGTLLECHARCIGNDRSKLTTANSRVILYGANSANLKRPYQGKPTSKRSRWQQRICSHVVRGR